MENKKKKRDCVNTTVSQPNGRQIEIIIIILMKILTMIEREEPICVTALKPTPTNRSLFCSFMSLDNKSSWGERERESREQRAESRERRGISNSNSIETTVRN